MTVVTTNIIGTQVEFSWTAPFDSYEAIDLYDLQIRNADGTFYADGVNCPGTPVAQTSCLVEMDTLISATGMT